MTNKLEYHIKIYDIIKSCEEAWIDAAFIEIERTESAEKQAYELGIETEKIQDKLRLLTKSIKMKVFKSLDEFLYTKEIKDDSNFLIFDSENPISYFDCNTYENFKPSGSHLVTNLKSYLDFLSLLKKHESETDDAFHFVDSYHKDSRRISFVSLSEHGRLNITYGLQAPNFDSSKDLRIGFEKFKSCFDNENKSLVKFLKSATISIASNFPSDVRLKTLFESLDDIVYKARVNFEVYLNNLSIDKIKKDYDEVKSKYFNSLNDILSNLSQKILALPIGIAAILFAIDRINDSDFFLIFILTAIIITSVYLSLLLRVHFKDLLYISRIFHYDYKTLLENNFFFKYPDEKQLFEEIKTRITERISFLKTIVESYYWIMNISNIIIVYIIFTKVEFIENGLVLIALSLLLSVALFRNYVLETEKSES
jgi:hypothetical protein